jgi:hypothetical protein
MYNETFRKVALSLYSYLGNMKKVALALKIGIGTVWRWVRLGIQSKPRFPLANCTLLKGMLSIVTVCAGIVPHKQTASEGTVMLTLQRTC